MSWLLIYPAFIYYSTSTVTDMNVISLNLNCNYNRVELNEMEILGIPLFNP